MNRAGLYRLWRGKEHPWTQWVKPALFAEPDDSAGSSDPTSSLQPSDAAAWKNIDTSWLQENAAVIVDLPATESILLALALAQRGLRPVLSINASSAKWELIDMQPALDLLTSAAGHAAAFPEGPQVLPAFVLDARRNAHDGKVTAGAFDNRWAIFPSDMPNAHTLRGLGITQVTVVQYGTSLLGDLEAIVRAYQEAGLKLSLRNVKSKSETLPLQLASQHWLSRLTDTIVRRFSLKRRRDGGFGSRIPMTTDPRHG